MGFARSPPWDSTRGPRGIRGIRPEAAPSGFDPRPALPELPSIVCQCGSASCLPSFANARPEAPFGLGDLDRR